MTPDSDLIEDYLAHLATIRAPKTVRTYSRILWAAHRELPTGAPTAKADEIAEWVLAHCRTPDSIRTYIAAFRSLARWTVAEGHISRDEAVQVHRPAKPEPLPDPCSDEQLATILDHVPEPARTWSLLAAYCGCRVVEISRLRREHITADRGTQLHGKRNKRRRVPTHPFVWEAVRDLPPGPLVRAGWVGNGDRVGGHLRWHYHQVGVPVHPHQLRHWYGTTLVASGAGVEEVQQLMGHSRITTTMGYIRVANPRLRAAVDRLPGVTAAVGDGQDRPAPARLADQSPRRSAA